MKNLSQRLILAGAGYKQRVQNRIRDATDLTKFATCTIMLLVTSSMLFCALIFRTNTIYSFRDLDFFSGDRLAKLVKYNTTVTSIKDWIPSNGALGSIPGITIVGSGNGKSQCPDYDVYTYPKELYDSILSGEIHQWLTTYRWYSAPGSQSVQIPDEVGAHVIAGLFNYMCTTDKFGDDAPYLACGIIANMMCESGGVLTIQDAWRIPGWPAGETRIHNSATLNAAKNCAALGNPNQCGFGALQYTSLDKLNPYLAMIEKYFPASGELSNEDLAAAELDYIITMVIPYAIADDKARGDGDAIWTSPYVAGAGWVCSYEMPGWKIQNNGAWAVGRGKNSEDLWEQLKKCK